MNLSAAYPGIKPYIVLYLDYNDWSAVVELAFGVSSSPPPFAIRGDGPNRGEWVAARHNKGVNVCLVDTHVERLVPEKLIPPADPYAPSIWHPRRPAGWSPPPSPAE